MDLRTFLLDLFLHKSYVFVIGFSGALFLLSMISSLSVLNGYAFFIKHKYPRLLAAKMSINSFSYLYLEETLYFEVYRIYEACYTLLFKNDRSFQEDDYCYAYIFEKNKVDSYRHVNIYVMFAVFWLVVCFFGLLYLQGILLKSKVQLSLSYSLLVIWGILIFCSCIIFNFVFSMKEEELLNNLKIFEDNLRTSLLKKEREMNKELTEDLCI